MPNVVITSVGTTVRIRFHDEADRDKRTAFHRNDIDGVKLRADDALVEIHTKSDNFLFSYQAATNAKIVDTVDGVVPTDNVDLYQMLVAIL